MKKFLLLLAVFAFLTSCSDDDKENDEVGIVGSWGLVEVDRCDGSGINIEEIWLFNEDGSLEINCAPTSCDCDDEPDPGVEKYGYTIDGDKITLYMKSIEGSISRTYKYSISGYNLKIYSDDEELGFERQQSITRLFASSTFFLLKSI